MNIRKLGTDEVLCEIAAQAKSAYDSLGPEYYSSLHPDSQIFDVAIDEFLRSQPFRPESGSLHIEVGAGRGRIFKRPEFAATRIVLTDVSEYMLANFVTDNHPLNVDAVVASAFELPFEDSSCSGVYSFLGDPYALPPFFTEAYRVMSPGASFLFIEPSATWGHTLRLELGIPLAFTVFTTYDGHQVKAPSFLYRWSEMDDMLASTGFTEIHHTAIRVPGDMPRHAITPHILIPSQVLSLDPLQIPILDAYWARK